ncbi:hypothetical protein D3C71_1511210 [compost metagenome]
MAEVTFRRQYAVDRSRGGMWRHGQHLFAEQSVGERGLTRAECTKQREGKAAAGEILRPCGQTPRRRCHRWLAAQQLCRSRQRVSGCR